MHLLNKIDWSRAANIATTLGLILTIVVLIYEITENRKTTEFAIFLRYQETYIKISEKRISTWNKIKEAILSNPKTEHEISDKSSSFDYLNIRIKQQEPLFAIEHQLIDEEIRTLNILNEICKYALRDRAKLDMIKILYSQDISFYQNSINDLNGFRKLCSKERLMPKPTYTSIKKIKINDYFEK